MSDGRESVRELDAARWRVALGLTAAMVVLYFGFVLLVAYGRPLLAVQVVPGLTLGILLGCAGHRRLLDPHLGLRPLGGNALRPLGWRR